jgi:hypothetical protein
MMRRRWWCGVALNHHRDMRGREVNHVEIRSFASLGKASLAQLRL